MSKNPELGMGSPETGEKNEKLVQPQKSLVEILEEMKAEEMTEEGKGEMNKVLAEIKEDYGKRIEKTKELPRKKKRILILDCSDTIALGPLTVLADKRLNASNVDMVDVIKKIESLPPSLDEVAGVIITGSSANIEDKEKSGCEWIQKTEEFVKKVLAKNIPTLGVCFGIQMHADIQGREVPKNEGGRELGVWRTSIYRDETIPQHPIFKGIEFQKDPQSDKESTLIETLGSHAFHAGYGKPERTKLYGLHYTKKGDAYPMIEIEGSFVGLQFHPECSTKHGIELLEAIGKTRYNILKEEGKNPDKIYQELQEYRKNNDLEDNDNLRFLNNFVDWAMEKEESKAK